MNRNEKNEKRGKINPEGTLPNFLGALSGKILQPYLGHTHGCVADFEEAVFIQGEPEKFYGVHKSLVVWGGN